MIQERKFQKLKTTVSVATYSACADKWLYGQPLYLQKCNQCNKNSYCLSVKYNKKFKEFYLCVNCCDFPFINWDRQHYIAWWLKVNLKRIYERNV